MIRKFIDPVRGLDWSRLRARAGAFASTHKRAGRRILTAAGFLFIVPLVHREVYSYIVKRSLYAVPEIRTAVAPPWADGRGVEIVRVDTRNATLFDRDLVDRVAHALEACPWVRRVTSVERVFPDRLRVRFEYRRPRVAVRRGAGYVLVDGEGVRLPGVYTEPPACERPARIAGVDSTPPEPGKTWDDPALRAGMEMADYVVRTAPLDRIGVREIDVSNFGGRLDRRLTEVTLVSATGCSLQWGRLPETARFGDLESGEKLENLREVMAAYPGLRGLRSVKLYFRGSRAIEPLEAHVNNPR